MKLNKKLSQYWHHIQGNLFPWLKEALGPLTEKHHQLITVLEFARLEEFIPTYGGVGRPLEDRCAIARAFMAKAVYNLSTTTHLRDRLVVEARY